MQFPFAEKLRNTSYRMRGHAHDLTAL